MKKQSPPPSPPTKVWFACERGGVVLRNALTHAKLPAYAASGRSVGTSRRLASPRLLVRASVSAGDASLGGIST